MPEKKGHNEAILSIFPINVLYIGSMLKLITFLIFLTNLGSIPLKQIFQTYCTPPMWPISDFVRYVQQLHYDTEKCRSDEIRGGTFSIRPLFILLLKKSIKC